MEKQKRIIGLVNKAFESKVMREEAIETISCGCDVETVTEAVAFHAEASSALSGYEEYICIKGAVEEIFEELRKCECKDLGELVRTRSNS